ncbi:MAG: FKBP-type peptidyl-prolyl cis-trans isomerase [Flavobacteriaceae bacterium]
MLQPKLTRFTFVFLFLLILGYSCNKEESESLELRDVQTQFNEDEQALLTYLESHFYNYEDFEADPSNYNLRISIDTLTAENSAKTPLIDQVAFKTVEVNNADGDVINHKLYYLVVREGKGERPAEVDSTYVRYKGTLLNGMVFDQRELPLWFNLPEVVPGFRKGIPELRAGSFSENPDGTFDFYDYGQGVLFMPSGLAYYANAQAGIPAYSPLIFTLSLFTIKTTDHDGDGVLSRDEDINGDGNSFNDDTDGDGTADMYDTDDDGDGVPTRDELDLDENGIPGDSDSDGIPNYLDSDSA